MNLEREILMSHLLQIGITEACGKPIEEASVSELQQEWAKHESKEGTTTREKK